MLTEKSKADAAGAQPGSVTTPPAAGQETPLLADCLTIPFPVSTQPHPNGCASDFELMLFSLHGYQSKLVSLLALNRDDEEAFRDISQDVVSVGELITTLAHQLYNGYVEREKAMRRKKRKE